MHRRVFCFDLSGVMYHQSQTKPARGAHDSVWDKFYEACLREDRPNLAFFAVFKGLYPSALIWTGRPEKFRERTLAKLLDDGMPIPLETLGEHLLMREDDERRPNRLLKKHWAKNFLEEDPDVELIFFESDIDVANTIARFGLACLVGQHDE